MFSVNEVVISSVSLHKSDLENVKWLDSKSDFCCYCIHPSLVDVNYQIPLQTINSTLELSGEIVKTNTKIFV